MSRTHSAPTRFITEIFCAEQFPTGLALAIEKKSRRIEISLYCLARAIESFFTCTTEAGYLLRPKNLKRVDVCIFSLSTAIIMHCYAIEREVFRSKYLNVLDWVFGVPLPPYETTPRKRRWPTMNLQIIGFGRALPTIISSHWFKPILGNAFWQAVVIISSLRMTFCIRCNTIMRVGLLMCFILYIFQDHGF